jgi:hypothetical protein
MGVYYETVVVTHIPSLAVMVGVDISSWGRSVWKHRVPRCMVVLCVVKMYRLLWKGVS